MTKQEGSVETNELKPDWNRECDNCGQSPVVDYYTNGKKTGSSDMCGPCTFGEAECLDPDKW